MGNPEKWARHGRARRQASPRRRWALGAGTGAGPLGRRHRHPAAATRPRPPPPGHRAARYSYKNSFTWLKYQWSLKRIDGRG